jgi:hypothetical protein
LAGWSASGQKQTSALTSSYGSFVPATAIHPVSRQRQLSGQNCRSKQRRKCPMRASLPCTGKTNFYSGNVKKFGLDIGTTGKSYVKWVVFAPVGRPRAGGLAGTYVGVSEEATAGAGVGANGLVGGSDRTFSLQPFSASIQTGVNLALGIGSMTLRYDN